MFVDEEQDLWEDEDKRIKIEKDLRASERVIRAKKETTVEASLHEVEKEMKARKKDRICRKRNQEGRKGARHRDTKISKFAEPSKRAGKRTTKC